MTGGYRIPHECKAGNEKEAPDGPEGNSPDLSHCFALRAGQIRPDQREWEMPSGHELSVRPWTW
jgi:hypothetical protein